MFNKIRPEDICDNAIKLFKDDKPICVCGDLEKHNGLTIAWGSIGSLWRKNIATIYIKPTRYTFKFANECEYFSIMWFDEDKQKEINKVFGTLSGRDVDKEKLCNLKPINLDNAVAYAEAKMVMVCKKIYQNTFLKENIFDENVVNMPLYEDGLFHSEYIGEIISVYIKSN